MFPISVNVKKQSDCERCSSGRLNSGPVLPALLGSLRGNGAACGAKGATHPVLGEAQSVGTGSNLHESRPNSMKSCRVGSGLQGITSLSEAVPDVRSLSGMLGFTPRSSIHTTGRPE